MKIKVKSYYEKVAEPIPTEELINVLAGRQDLDIHDVADFFKLVQRGYEQELADSGREITRELDELKERSF